MTWQDTPFPTLLDEQLRVPEFMPHGQQFPVTQRYDPTMTDATITYHGAITGGGWVDWLKANQTTVLIAAGGLFVLAVVVSGKRRR